MLLPTHLVTANTAYITASVLANHTPNLIELLIALIACQLPDLDSKQSIIGRFLFFISHPLEHYFAHRTITHSLLLQLILCTLLFMPLPFGIWLAFTTGWVSHSLADMMTPSGIAWFYPSKVRCVFPGNPQYRFECMSFAELGFMIVIDFLGAFFLWMAQTQEIKGNIVRQILANPEHAREQFDAIKGTNEWTMEVTGRDNVTYDVIDGTYPVIGHYLQNGFILETTTGPKSACRDFTCDWYLAKGLLIISQTAFGFYA